MSWKEGFDAALLRLVREDLGAPDATEVTGFEQREIEGYRWSSYTFEPASTIVDIRYRASGYASTVTWKGDFSDLIRKLAAG